MLGLRWTIGEVNVRGYDALRLSLWGAWRLFGAEARYRVYVNTMEVAAARALTGDVPPGVEWRQAHRADLPAWLERRMDAGLAQGVAWKLIPMRAFPDAHELSIDNDVVLWARPRAIQQWLDGAADLVLAEDVSRCFGAFDAFCPAHGVNSGIRGLPPRFDLDASLRSMLRRHPAPLREETDEQGLQTAALLQSGTRTSFVSLDDVTICSPFPPHVPHLGRAGAHFVGLNTRRLGFTFNGRAAEVVRAEHWDACVDEVARRVGGAEART